MSTEEERAAVRSDVAEALAAIRLRELALEDEQEELADIQSRCPHYLQSGPGVTQYICADCGQWLAGADIRAVVTRSAAVPVPTATEEPK